jgi:hypothetical protein
VCYAVPQASGAPARCQAGSLSHAPDRGSTRKSAGGIRIRTPAEPREKELFLGSSRIWLQSAHHALQGRDDPRCSGMVSGHSGGQGLLHACVDASGTAEGWKHGRGPSAFLGRHLSRHPRPQPGADVLPQAHRIRPPRTPDARSGEARAREKAGGVPAEGSREGTVRGIAHRVKPEGWVAGRCGGKGVPEKNADGPLPDFHPPAVPDIPREARCGPPLPTCRKRCRAWCPPTAPRHAWRATKSAMNLFLSLESRITLARTFSFPAESDPPATVPQSPGAGRDGGRNRACGEPFILLRARLAPGGGSGRGVAGIERFWYLLPSFATRFATAAPARNGRSASGARVLAHPTGRARHDHRRWTRT